MSDGLVGLAVVTALGCGTIAGVFFAFSAFVMPALARLPAPEGIAAMQAINVAAVRPAFMAALFGTAAACLALGVWSLLAWQEPYAVYLLLASVLYLLGTIALTIAYHVPRNNALAAVHPGAADAPSHWSAYVASWTAGNHARAAAALAAAALLMVALRVD